MSEKKNTAMGPITQKQWANGIAAGEMNARKRGRRRSVRLQALVYFFLLTVLTLFVLWLLQFVFYKSAYRSMKKQELERLGASIADRYPGCAGDKAYAEYLRKIALRNGLNIIVFHAEESFAGCPLEQVGFKAEYLSSQFNADSLTDKGLITVDDPRIIGDWEKFYVEMRQSERVSYFTDDNRGAYMVYGSQLGESGSYLYMTASYQPMETTITVITDQLLFATAVCLVLGVLMSWLISNRITKPITEFSRVAEKLGAGDYSVRFNGNGYAEIENLADTLNYATEEIGKTEQLRRDFLANVGHDLRTPLTMVKAYAEMIRDISGADEQKRAKHSQVIIDEADRLTRLVNDILIVSKLQSDTVAMEMGKVDMCVLTKCVLERFDVYAARDGYSFEFSSSGNGTAYGDYKQLEQVVYNLVDNAVSHAGDDKKVCIEVKGTEQSVRVAVRDFGSGIAPEELDKVWERYYRANQSKRNVAGSGLGLSIVKGILTAHGAAFGVSSTLGEGTEFWFELRLDAPAPPLPPAEQDRKKSKRKK